MTEEYADLEGFTEEEDDKDGPISGVREPKKPILPALSGAIAIEREEEIDLLLCSDK
jgi:hypothetical protein